MVTYATPYITAAFLSSPACSKCQLQSVLTRNGRRRAEGSSFGCWDECFLPWLPNFMVNDDPYPPPMTVPTELLGPAGTARVLGPRVVTAG